MSTSHNIKLTGHIPPIIVLSFLTIPRSVHRPPIFLHWVCHATPISLGFHTYSAVTALYRMPSARCLALGRDFQLSMWEGFAAHPCTAAHI
jgi:hypothetical protein